MADSNWLHMMTSKIKGLLKGNAAPEPEPPPPPEEDELCCRGRVHIAYRGISDERMYIAKDRGWAEVKFFRPNGLRVFCSDCRRRLL